MTGGDKKPDDGTGSSEETSSSSNPRVNIVTNSPRGSRRGRFISVHRRNINRISVDAAQGVKHDVPTGSFQDSKFSLLATKRVSQVKEHYSHMSLFDWLQVFIPCLKWLKSYDYKSKLFTDIMAGATVGIMIVPQSMSYAKLAGLPVEYGLYSAFIPVFTYSFFGSSRQLAVGPVALISLLLSTGLSSIMNNKGISVDDPEYNAIYTTLAIQTAFLVGVTYIIMGLLQLGFVTIFLSHAVVSGFTTGAAVIIGMSQVKYIFGYDIDNDKAIHRLLRNIFENIDQFNYKTFVMGVCSIIALVVLKNIGKSYPRFKWVRAVGPLTVTVITIFFTWIFSLDEQGIPIVESIPQGLPNFTGNLWVPIDDFGTLATTVISIAVVGFMESIAIAKQLASVHKYELDSSLELIGLGMANFMGAMFGSYPVTGSFSRSAVNNSSGAQSGISGVVTATIVAVALLFLTSVFEQMPLSVLAAIVISGVFGLLDYPEAIYLWKVHKFDFTVWLIACLFTMFLGVEIGLATAVGVSILMVIYESAYPHTAVLGRLQGTTVYRNIKQYPDAEQYDGILLVRVDAPIYFANTQNVREKLHKYEARAEEKLRQREIETGKAGTTKYIVLELSPVSHIDSSALHILHDMVTNYKDRGIELCLCNPNLEVMDRLKASGLAEKVGREHIFVQLHDALTWCLQQLDEVAVSEREADMENQLTIDLVGSDSD